ncbi:protein kinase [Nocardia sp. NBC_00881]|uniref:protein kinase domain-containing protein n=1 Tax=Nocardia sp. NBC_00881 TaxID=2975995 RepID=UPI00386A7901|nr:protein kinase [Nocardia sp. NBC_00881]
MAECDDLATQRDLPLGIAAELAAAGLGDAGEIGRGGFGVVYCCYQYALERHVAVKVLTSEVRGDEREQFVREQRALGRLSGHPHILQVLQADITPTGRPYIVMPYHARGSLEQVLHKTGPLRWPEVLSVGVKMAGALAAAHAIGIVHRDLKPGNILLTDYGEPHLADFGIAQFGEATTSSLQIIQGTPAFTAPEVLGGAAPTAASDIYGLGATLFSLLTGRAAFARRTGEQLEVQLARIATGSVPDLHAYGIPHAVCEAVEAAMAAKPTDRPATAVEFGEQLREVQRNCGQAVDAMAVPPDTPVAEMERRAALSVLPAHSPGSVTPPVPPIAATKFRPPSTPRTLIERTRILDILRHGEQRRLTVIHGPAGFGKTTLALQWGRRLESDGAPMAWLTADSDDDNAVWFLAHLVEAIRRVRPELARELGALLEERSSDTTRYVLCTLIDEIHDSGQAMVLVIDDWHRVTSDATRAALEFLLEHGCHHLWVVVASRTRAGLPLTRMLVRDELVEIDVTALRFDAAETTAFLIDNGLLLSAADVTRLQESTEGWPAALQLASLSLRGRNDPSAFIDRLTGRHHVIGEYLAENVLDALEPQLLDFLLSTSITGKVRADLATLLSDRADSQEMLEQVADRNLFLYRLDEDDEWFRYHHLFAEYLQRRLVRSDPDRLAQLHRRASAWFAEHEMLTDAVDHAMSAGDPQRAVDLVEARALDLIERSRMATFLGMMAKLPGSLTESRPRLQLCVAWANLGLQRRQRTRTALKNVLAALDSGAVPAEEVTALRVEAALVTCVEEYVTDRFDGLPKLVAEHIDDAAAPFVANNGATLAATDALNRFDFAAALQWHQRAAPYHRGRTFGMTHNYCVAGLAAYEQLDITRAEEHFEDAVSMARRSGAPTHSSILAGALLGALRYEQGRLAEAEQLLNSSARLGRQGGPVDFLSATYGTGARLAALRGDPSLAQKLLAEGWRIAEDAALPRLAARIVNEHIRIGLPIPDDVRTHLTHLPLYRKQDNRIRAGIAELEQDSAIRLLLAEHSPTRIEEACARADHMMREIETQSRPRALAQGQLLYACCLWEAHRIDDAKTILAPALSLATRQGLLQFVTDAGPHMSDIVAASA